MTSSNRAGRSTLVLVLLAVGLAGLLGVGAVLWMGSSSKSAVSATIQPPADEVELSADTTNLALRAPVQGLPAEPAPPESAVPTADPTNAPEPSSAADEVPKPADGPFPYGRPTPDWVFEQKYAGMSESELDDMNAKIKAEYYLVSKAAFKECRAAGDYELLPLGASSANPSDPSDDRIVGTQSAPGGEGTMVTRLSVEKYPQVYQLFYEHLWLSTRKRSP